MSRSASATLSAGVNARRAVAGTPSTGNDGSRASAGVRVMRGGGILTDSFNLCESALDRLYHAAAGSAGCAKGILRNSRKGPDMPQLAQIIEFLDPTGAVLAVRFPASGDGIIEWGSQLIVREGQVALLL